MLLNESWPWEMTRLFYGREYEIARLMLATIFGPRRVKPSAVMTSATISSSVRRHPSDSTHRSPGCAHSLDRVFGAWHIAPSPA